MLLYPGYSGPLTPIQPLGLRETCSFTFSPQNEGFIHACKVQATRNCVLGTGGRISFIKFIMNSLRISGGEVLSANMLLMTSYLKLLVRSFDPWTGGQAKGHLSDSPILLLLH